MTPDTEPGPRPASEPSRPEPESGSGGRPRWVTPAGITAFAGLLAATATLVSVFKPDGGPSPVKSAAATPAARAAAPTLDPQNGPTIGETTQLLKLLRDVGTDALSAGGEPYADFIPVKSPQGSVSTELPLDWKDTSFSGWLTGEGQEKATEGVALVSAPNERLFYESLSTPGLFYGVSKQLAKLTPEQAAERFGTKRARRACRLAATGDVRTGRTQGVYELWRTCGKDQSLVLQVVTRNQAGFLTFLWALMADQRDVDALAQFYSQLEVTPPIETVRGKIPIATGVLPGDYLD